METALKKGLKELAPVRLSLSQSDTDPEHGSFAIEADPDGDEDRAVEQVVL